MSNVQWFMRPWVAWLVAAWAMFAWKLDAFDLEWVATTGLFQ